MSYQTCCFFGHRTISETEELRTRLKDTIRILIVSEGVDTFLFGSKSRFDELCLELVSELKTEYPHIKRVYVRAEFPIIDKAYTDYLLNHYEETYYPEKIKGAGRAVYVERNCEMIDQSQICVVYDAEEQMPTRRKSGTKIALSYARKKEKRVILFP